MIILQSDLWIGTTLAIFKHLGNTPYNRQSLQSEVIKGVITGMDIFKIFALNLTGPQLLSELRLFIIRVISVVLVGLNNMMEETSFDK